jgi:putative SOS response-associated peptidase YedK
MCGRFTLTKEDPAEVAQDLGVPPAQITQVDYRPRYNIAPTQPVPVIRQCGSTTVRRLEALRWGLIPSWAKDPAIGSRMINARGETVSSKPSFRSAFRQRRCLVIADGFYEWQKVDPAGSTSKTKKQPYYIHLRDERPFAMAGLWEHWESTDGTAIESCTIITTQPNEVMAPLHDRMPVILGSNDYDKWLDPENKKIDELQNLLRPCAPNDMDAYPVSTRVNSPANDSPDCICQ